MSPPATLIRFGDPAGARGRRLLCLPFAGGGPATYRLWPQTLLDVEVLVA
jgi:surfactin synthase thioesterase subunit